MAPSTAKLALLPLTQSAAILPLPKNRPGAILIPMSNPRPWKALSRKITQHSPYMSIEDTEFELPDGKRLTYALTSPGIRTVCVLALTSDLRVVLARQFRPGPDEVLDELPGGRADGGETFEDAVRRELLEETGFVPGKIAPLGRFFECAYSRIERQGFLALDCERRDEQSLDPTEFIQVVLKPLPEFLAQLRKGNTTDGEVAWAGLFEAGLVHARI